jgi:FG-GAP-like repeat
MNFARSLFPHISKTTPIIFVFIFNLLFSLNAFAIDPSYKMDFDGDGKTDLAVYRPGQRNVFPFRESYFYILGSQTGQVITHQWGRAYDIHAPADYDGDGKTDVAVFRWLENDLTPSASDFYVKNSSGGNVTTRFSGFGNIVSRNYFDDAKAEIALFDRYNSSEDPINPCYIMAFYIKAAGTNFALKKDVTDYCLPDRQYITPAVFDYNGSGDSDLAVLVQPAPDAPNRSSSDLSEPLNNHFNLWWSPVSPQYTPPDVVIYMDVDYPIPGDYDGDGIGDFAGSKTVNGNRLWRIRKSTGGGIVETLFGLASDYAVPGDYDGDGKTDIAVYRSGIWFILQSSDGQLVGREFGSATDIPLTMPNSNIYH